MYKHENYGSDTYCYTFNLCKIQGFIEHAHKLGNQSITTRLKSTVGANRMLDKLRKSKCEPRSRTEFQG